MEQARRPASSHHARKAFPIPFAKQRAVEKIKSVEAELDRRGLVSAQGDLAFVSRQLTEIGLVDIKRLRADLGDEICREYAVPGSNEFWSSRALKL